MGELLAAFSQLVGPAVKLENLDALETLDELPDALQAEPPARLRKQLGKAFLKLCRYTNAEEWNYAVRLCEVNGLWQF